MSDQLTDRLKKQFAERAKANMDSVRQSQIEQGLRAPLPPQPSPPPKGTTLYDQFAKEQYPGWYDNIDDNEGVDFTNAAAATLWSLADTGSFGALGWASKALGYDVEESIDFDDPLAKWGSGFGSFLGYVKGAPLRLGAKAAKTLTRPLVRGILKNTGVRSTDDALKNAHKIGKNLNLKKSARDKVFKGYEKIVAESQLNPNITADLFNKNVSKYLDMYLAKGIGKEVTQAQAGAIRKMFTDGQLLTKRPVQDILGAITTRYGSSRFSRWMGHTVQDIAIYGTVDALYEGMIYGREKTVGDKNYQYNFMAPIFGAVNGAAFAGLSVLNPKGRGARWGADFKQGLRGAFSHNPYKKKNIDSLVRDANFFDEIIKLNNKSMDKYKSELFQERVVNIGGKNFHLGTSDLKEELIEKLGDKAEPELRKTLTKVNRALGRQMMKWASTEELSNIISLWPRMVTGGLLFNAHSFYESYANDYELTVHDLLPHFLIGAFMQRHSNPSKFDFTPSKMNQLRENMTLMGADPSKFSRIPTFDRTSSRFENIYNESKWKENEALAEELGIITDDYGQKEIPLPDNVESIARKPNPIFDKLYSQLKGRKLYIKNQDDISIEQADKLIENAIKIEPLLKNPLKSDSVFGESYMKTTEQFEDKFKEIIDYVESVDTENKTLIRTSLENRKGGEVTRIPTNISFEPLLEKAKRGELSWLKKEKTNSLGETEAVVLDGDEAAVYLSRIQESFNQILTVSKALNQSSPIRDIKKRYVTIDDENLVNEIFQKVSRVESQITNMYPLNSPISEGFSFGKNVNEYALPILHNHTIRAADKSLDIFRKNDDTLKSTLMRAGLLYSPSGIGKAKIIDKSNKIIIDTGGDGNIDESKQLEVAEARVFLDRVLSLQSIVNSKDYEGHVVNKGEIKVKLEDINILKSHLERNNLNISKMSDDMFSKVQNFALRELVKGTNLSVSQVNSLFDLVPYEGVRFSMRVAGEAGGFRVKTINESLSQDSKAAKTYNEALRKIEKDSNGLVVIEGEVNVLTLGELQGMRDALIFPNSKDNTSARQSIEQLLNQISIGKTNYASLSDQMRSFANSKDGNAIQLQKWLIDLKVIEPSRKQIGWDSDVSVLSKLLDPKDPKSARVKVNKSEALDDSGNIKIGYAASDDGKTYFKLVGIKVWEDLSRRMDDFGYTSAFADAQYNMYEKKAQDNLLIDTDESTYEQGITLNQFFSDYRVDNPEVDYTSNTPEEQSNKFKELIYPNSEDGFLKLDIFNKLLNRMYIKRKGEYYKFNSEDMPEFDVEVLSKDVQLNKKNEILNRISGLIKQQKGQVRLNVMKFENNQIYENFQVMQKSGFYSYIHDQLQIPYQIVDPRAVVYELSGDGRFVRKNVVDLFGKTPNLSQSKKDQIEKQRILFQNLLQQKTNTTPDQTSTQSGLGEIGIEMFQILPNMEPIAIQKQHLKNIDTPYLDFADKYLAKNSGIDDPVQKKIRDIVDAIKSDSEVTPDLYNEALKHLVSEKAFTGSDGNKAFIDYLNGNVDINKMMGRIRLFNTKAFMYTDNNFNTELQKVHRRFGNKKVADVIEKFSQRKDGNGGYNLAIWNDVDFANLKEEVNTQLKDLNINQNEWEYSHQIGKAHEDVTSFDSISYVSRNMLIFAKTIMGHNPNSFTPIKPVINSNGENSPLVLGKTLFVYSKKLDNFFRANDIDILLSRSGAKVYNSDVGEGTGDISLIHKTYDELEGHLVRGSEKRVLSIDSIGFKPEKDYFQHTAKTALADQNYADNNESSQFFQDEYKNQLDINIQSIKTVLRDPITTRKWILSDLENDNTLSSALQETEGLTHLNNMAYFSTISRDADPMSYSDTIVKNKLYQVYVDKLLNGSRSITNQFNAEGSDRYGGQGILIQQPDKGNRLKGTFVDKHGTLISRGEVMIPKHEEDSNILNFMKDGIGLRFVIAGEKLANKNKDGKWEYKLGKKAKNLFTGEEIFGEEVWQGILDKAAGEGVTLGALHGHIKKIASEDSNFKGLSIAIATRRNPRTRPNDISILGLKGFLDKEYGNSLAINSFDVANVYEGDYDVDKADYWFGQRDNFWSHVDRASQFYVQGIDPTGLMMQKPFKWSMPTDQLINSIDEANANLNLYKSSIGRVQKIPRILGYLDKMGYETIEGNTLYEGWNKTELGKRRPLGENSKILLGSNKGDDYMVTLDYNNLDYFIRSALETQYIIDGKGNINPNIASSIDTWADGFLFPKIEDSVSPSQAKEDGTDFINDIRNTGNRGGKRVRIFRRIEKDGDNFIEKDLTNLDKAVIKELMSQYSGLLRVTRDSMYENTGQKVRTSYEDIFDTAQEFFLFNREVKNSIYYRLRNKFIDRDAKFPKKWNTDKDFIDIFGHQKKQYEDKFGNKKEYFISTKSIINDGAAENAKGFYEGTRGAPIERVFQQMVREDPFERTSARQTAGDVVGLMDSWYNELLSGSSSSDVTSLSDRLNSTVSKGVLDYNKKLQVIGSMKRKIVQIYNNYKIPYNVKKSSIDKMNKSISEIEKEILPLIPKKYWKTRKIKDIPKMKIVPVDAKNLQQGTIYYNTMHTVDELLPGMHDGNFSLNEGGRKLLKDIKSIRRIFYGNNTSLKDIYKYDANRTILNSSQRTILEKFPTLSTYYQIETDLLLQGFNNYGPQFIYSFMKPAQNKYNVGVFEGKVISVPYEASEAYDPGSRYRRGMKFLTAISRGDFKDSTGIKVDPQVASRVRQSLEFIQFVEANWQRFFNRKFHLKNLTSRKEPADYSDLSLSDALAPEQMILAKSNIYSQMRLPNINKDVQRMFSSFKSINWKAGNQDKIGSGYNLTNDHLLDFYNDIMKIAGKEEEFTEYREMVNDIESQMINNDVIDPVEYMSMRNRMDKDVVEIASKIFTSGLSNESGNNVYVKNIKKNPIWALMGGEDYFKGYSFEKAPQRNIMQRLKTVVEMSNNFNNVKQNIDEVSIKSKETLDEILSDCGVM